MDVFQALADPARRRVCELTRDRPMAAGELHTLVGQEFGISQPAVSRHLKVLREAGALAMHREGTSRLYQLDISALEPVQSWVTSLHAASAPTWESALDALGTEVRRGKKRRREAAAPEPVESAPDNHSSHRSGESA